MEVFVARQPIFTRSQRVIGYELLYRSGKQNCYDHTDGDRATSDVITNSFSVIGMDVLTGGKRAFINFTQNLLKQEIVTIAPPQSIVVEILEDIIPDAPVLSACKRLKELGYTLALDDFVTLNEVGPLVDLADIIKVDFIKTPLAERRKIPKEIGNTRIKFLAEKVETAEEFQEALMNGYSYFQGYFFSKPVLFSGKDLTPYKTNYLEIIQEINYYENDLDKIEAIVKRDISLSYKLLRLINSAAFGLNSKISSIKQALMLLGAEEFVKWVTLISLRKIGGDKPDELIVTSLIRAKFAELLAPEVGLKDYTSDLFLMGMFSMIDALLDRPLQNVMDELPISQTIKEALLGANNQFGAIFNLIAAYERGQWNAFSEASNRLSLNKSEVSKHYLEALKWVREIFE